MLDQLRAVAKYLKQELRFYQMVLKHPGTPFIAKMLLGAAIAYALSAFDLIPDWIPVLGQLDDLIIVPALIVIALKMIPADVKQDCREKIRRAEKNDFES